MSISHLIAILKARWLSAAIAFALVAGLVVAYIGLQSKRYTATASVLLDVKSPDPIAGMVLQGMMSPSYMLTQVDVIQSQRVATRAARSLGLLADPEMRQRWQQSANGQGTFESFVADWLRESLDVRPSRGSNVIYVAVTHKDPKFAAAAANAFVQSYVDTTLELRVEPARQYSKFFDLHAKQLRGELESAQARLSEYRQTNGILDSDNRLDIESSQLTELSSQLIAMQATASESGSRSGQATAHADRMPEALSNSVVSSLRSDLARQEVRLEEIETRLGSAHPQVKELQSNVAQLKERIQVESRRVAESVGVNNSVNSARLGQLRRSVDEQRTKVLRMKQRRDEAAVLQQDVQNAQRAYDGVLARLTQASLEGQTAQANVSALEQASEPTLPSSPQVRTGLILGCLAALGLAVATALLREWRDRRVRSATELALLADQPLLVIIPSFGKKGRKALPISPKRLALGLRSALYPAPT